MLRDGANDIEETAWGHDGHGDTELDWKAIDRELCDIAKRRGALDGEEATLLCQAIRAEVWRKRGNGSLLDYLEERLGYGPKAAHERVRIAMALDELPELEQALAGGELPFSAIRELTRVATPATERAWLDDSRGKRLRQLEHMVSGRKKGDLPTDPPDPKLVLRTLRFEVRPETFARLREVQQVLEANVGMRLDDDALIAALCDAVLDRGDDRTDHSGRARHQIVTFKCERCAQGFEEGGGVKFAINATALAIAECDAQRIGSIEGGTPARATQDVPPRTQRFVRRRDGNRCCVDGCRAARHCHIHHIVPRAAGGSHKPENICLVCSSHHRALHDGLLTISGIAPNVEVRWTRDTERSPHVGRQPVADAKSDKREQRPPHVGAIAEAKDIASGEDRSHATRSTTFGAVVIRHDASQALVQLGFKRREVRAALDAACAGARPNATLEQLVFEALRHCPKPRG